MKKKDDDEEEEEEERGEKGEGKVMKKRDRKQDVFHEVFGIYIANKELYPRAFSV